MKLKKLLDELVDKRTPDPKGYLHYDIRAHGFSPSYGITVETDGKIRRRRLDMSMRQHVEWEATVSADDLAYLARIIRDSGFPNVEIDPGYQPRPDIGLIVVTVADASRASETAEAPQDAHCWSLESIGTAFFELCKRAGH